MAIQTAFLHVVPQKPADLALVRASIRQISDWRKLLTKKGRREAGQVLLEGARLVGEAVVSDVEVSAVVVADVEHGHRDLRKLLTAVNRRSAPIFAVPPRDFEKLTDTVHASGIACVIKWNPRRFNPTEVSQGLRRVLICDRIADPGNLGTLIRTAAGLGMDAVFLLPETAELSNPKTVRAAAGAFFHIPVYEDVAPQRIISWARQASITIFVADAHRGESVALVAPKHWALVVGGETIQLDKAWESSASRWISLPLHRGVESLNAAVAGAIIMDRLCHASERPPSRGRQQRS